MYHPQVIHPQVIGQRVVSAEPFMSGLFKNYVVGKVPVTWDLENNASLGIIGFRPDQDVDNVGKLGVADVVVDLDVLVCPSGSHSYT